MARLNVRDFPDHLHQLLLQAAGRHERSLEGETRFGLACYLGSLKEDKGEPLSNCQIWQRDAGQRLQRLFDQLREDKVFEWDERSDLPHLALALNEPSPATLINCVEGLEPLSFNLAKRIVDLFGCSLTWLISGSGRMFDYSEVGVGYHDFFSAATRDTGCTITLVRICADGSSESKHPRHDGTLLMFKRKGDSKNITAGYSGRFYLNDCMGSGGEGNLRQFVGFLNKVENVSFHECNTTLPTGAYELGDHHPNFYLDLTRCSKATWLYPLKAGISPSQINWTEQYGYMEPKPDISEAYR